MTSTSDNECGSEPSRCLPRYVHESESEVTRALRPRPGPSRLTVRQSYEQLLGYARGQFTDVHFLNIISSVLRTPVKPSFPSGLMHRSCSGLPWMLLPWASPSATEVSKGSSSVVQTPVNDREIFALVTSLGTALLLGERP